MNRIKVSRAGRWWLMGVAFAAGLLLAAALRYGILENDALDLTCLKETANGWCSIQSALGWSIHYQLFGLAGLFLGAAAWLPRLHGLAFPSLLVAGCGLLIYNTTYAAVAVIISLLAAMRPLSAAK